MQSSTPTMQLMTAIATQNEALLRQSLQAGVSPKTMIPDANNPYMLRPALLCTLLAENTSMAQVLFEAGAPVNEPFEMGTVQKTPLTALMHHTLRANSVVATKWLLDHGAHVVFSSHPQHLEVHPFFEALSLSHHHDFPDECLSMVIKAAPPLSKWSPFMVDHLVCYLHSDSDRALNVLWDHFGSALTTTPTSCGSLGLHASVYENFKELSPERLQWLVDHGADMHAPSNEFEDLTPWMILNNRRDEIPSDQRPSWEAFLLRTALSHAIDLTQKPSSARAKM